MSSDIIIDATDARAALERRKAAVRRRLQRAKQRDEVILSRHGIVWNLIQDRPGRPREVIRIDAHGHEVTQAIDKHVFSYSMLCSCGRTRYAKPNTLHEVVECRVCAHATKLARRAVRERGRSLAER